MRPTHPINRVPDVLSCGGKRAWRGVAHLPQSDAEVNTRSGWTSIHPYIFTVCA